jgi:hypothetical protein
VTASEQPASGHNCAVLPAVSIPLTQQDVFQSLTRARLVEVGRALHVPVPDVTKDRQRVQALASSQSARHVAAPELHTLVDEALAAHAPAATDGVRRVDFWHLLEKLGAAALAVAGEEHASALREKWKLSLLNTPGAAWTIAAALHASGKRDVVLGDRRPVHEALTYLENHGERMHYAEARARGLPIGSGNVEATCKSLVALRMKCPGARWKEESGQHVLDLRALMLSDRWDAAMNLTLAPQRAQVRRAA